MQRGGWVPISKALSRTLPTDRPYSDIEAAFSLQLDFDSGTEVTLSGYSSLWRWSKSKVRRFLNDLGVEIRYPKCTGRLQNQRGKLHPTDNRLITDRNTTDNRLIRFIDSKWLDSKSVRKPTDNRPKPDRCLNATTDPNPNPKPDDGKVPASLPPEFKESEKFQKAWSDWCKYRKEIGKALKQTTINLQSKALEGLGVEAAIIALENSMMSGWVGIFPPKEHRAATKEHKRRENSYQAVRDFVSDLEKTEIP